MNGDRNYYAEYVSTWAYLTAALYLLDEFANHYIREQILEMPFEIQ